MTKKQYYNSYRPYIITLYSLIIALYSLIIALYSLIIALLLPYIAQYAQTLILVNLILVNFFGFLVIARNPPERF